MTFIEKPTRSFVKGITYRILIIISTGVISWFVTKRVDISVSITLGTTILNTFIYYLHERIWNIIQWGKVVKTKKI